MTQCRLAQIVLHHTDCCDVDPPKAACDKEALLSAAFSAAAVPAFPGQNPLIFADVRTEIQVRRKPIACRIAFPPPAIDHFVQIDGVIENGTVRKYIVNDPKRGDVVLTPDAMRSNYANLGGQWTQAFRMS